MIDGLAQEVLLKAKARTGASGEFALWCCAAAVFALVAVVFLSIAAYVWLADLYGGANAAVIVGGVHVVLMAAAAIRCVVLRRRTKLRALAEMKAAEKSAPWWSDPAVLAIGYEAAKIIGWRKLTPLVAAGMLAATFGREHGKRDKRRADSGNHHAS